MQINADLCIGCGECNVFCPVGAIFEDQENNISVIDLNECIECGSCLRQAKCSVDAIYQQELAWPRSVRSIMSDPLTITKESGIAGRGTEEMKTNDVTGRFRHGYVGVGIEMGRPILGAYFSDVEKVAMAVSSYGVEFETRNPLTSLMADQSTGKFQDELLGEKVLSTIIEFTLPVEKMIGLLEVLKEVSEKIDTVFSLCFISRLGDDEVIPISHILDEAGIWYAPNGKANVGLGRPLFKEKGELV
jgi:NAD-dependent dihydropyrimidine dehydrogenase PreA subunit